MDVANSLKLFCQTSTHEKDHAFICACKSIQLSRILVMFFMMMLTVGSSYLEDLMIIYF